MSALARTETVEGWTLGFVDGDEPLVRDVDLAERLGFDRPRNIRKLIVRIFGERGVRSTVERTTNGRPGTEYWLTEAQALKVSAKSDTAQADAVLDAIIAVYMAWRNGQLTSAVPALLDGTTINSARIRDNEQGQREMRFAVHVVYLLRGYSKQMIHGWVRRNWRVPSVFDISTHLAPDVKRALELIARGETSIGSKHDTKRLTAAKKQLSLGKEWN